MNRRFFLKTATAAIAGAGFAPEALAHFFGFSPERQSSVHDAHIRDYLYKMRHFDDPHSGDVYLEPGTFKILESALKRLRALQLTVGHGNFYLLNFDEALNIAKHYTRVGRFTRDELEFFEMIFYEDGSHYGFFGKKPLMDLTHRIKKRHVIKIPYTGNYLYKGEPLSQYQNIKKDIGEQVVLTSGVRSVIKQFMLFLGKAYKHSGNLSLASRSLAPPGYSYHGVGDFDVGQTGLGAANFTERFTQTDVFKKLERLGYIKLRYNRDNLLGVRFEPWHIRVHTEI